MRDIEEKARSMREAIKRFRISFPLDNETKTCVEPDIMAIFDDWGDILDDLRIIIRVSCYAHHAYDETEALELIEERFKSLKAKWLDVCSYIDTPSDVSAIDRDLMCLEEDIRWWRTKHDLLVK